MRSSNNLEKKDFFRHILKTSASTYERSASQFFRTTAGMQPAPEAFDESRLVITFLTIFGVTGILRSFKSVLKGKQVERYQSYQNYSPYKTFQETILLCQMQKSTPQGH